MTAVSVKRSIKDAKLSRFSSDLLMSLRSRKHIVGDSPRAANFTFYWAAGFLEEHLSLTILWFINEFEK